MEQMQAEIEALKAQVSQVDVSKEQIAFLMQNVRGNESFIMQIAAKEAADHLGYFRSSGAFLRDALADILGVYIASFALSLFRSPPPPPHLHAFSLIDERGERETGRRQREMRESGPP
ncbi:hypothetical protein JHK87_053045 [Glycine soja]|nr:hypothetical protein JHK87_053045 [Glycine soja]